MISAHIALALALSLFLDLVKTSSFYQLVRFGGDGRDYWEGLDSEQVIKISLGPLGRPNKPLIILFPSSTMYIWYGSHIYKASPSLWIL